MGMMMKYTAEALAAHPGFNPAHNPNGVRRSQVVFDPTKGGAIRVMLVDKSGREIPRNPSRWLPHQGARECSRRLHHFAH